MPKAFPAITGYKEFTRTIGRVTIPQSFIQELLARDAVQVLDRVQVRNAVLQRPRDDFLFVANDNDFATTDGFQVGAAYNDGKDLDTMFLAYRVTISPVPPSISCSRRTRFCS